LVEFCSGFGYGLGLSSGGRDTASLPEDTREVIADFQSIESLDLDELDDSEDDAWQELYEFLRVGVLLVHEEMQPRFEVAIPITPIVLTAISYTCPDLMSLKPCWFLSQVVRQVNI